ncbi:DUF3299 domain-containing protein [Ferrimonas balearica]|uniref:DUF3299 domain-containing protein n=1 Tax=Ferrimonas balearica TaxID=44012 RepID=UPI001C997B0E|nr:DUF3299 domain-containing protein [Ferrimonas balearica]MBY5991346.1 DUF3299 domain-containing protein [Ferrimonas balearica]
MRALLLFVSAILMHGSLLAEPLELEWKDLRPLIEYEREQEWFENFQHGPDDDDENDEIDWVQPEGEILTEFDGKTVKLPGFILPLEGDDTKVTEFILVPYFGACVHVPPPPPNQLVYVVFEPGVPMDIIWDAFWIEGEMSVSTYDMGDFQAGYTIHATKAYSYSEE